MDYLIACVIIAARPINIGLYILKNIITDNKYISSESMTNVSIYDVDIEQNWDNYDIYDVTNTINVAPYNKFIAHNKKQHDSDNCALIDIAPFQRKKMQLYVMPDEYFDDEKYPVGLDLDRIIFTHKN